jgi:hypothetical protein
VISGCCSHKAVYCLRWLCSRGVARALRPMASITRAASGICAGRWRECWILTGRTFRCALRAGGCCSASLPARRQRHTPCTHPAP